ncbi:MAG: hypothetical protein OEO77_01305 [Acidimicrobiia bacterium]|nr:hypothetical protein [Acidimicrobiia bacterium]
MSDRSRQHLPPGWFDEHDTGVADRLDAMRAATVERVLRRAIELQSDELHQPDVFDKQMLQRIADELGVNPAYVEQALAEELVVPPEEVVPTVLHRFLAPSRMAERATVTGSRDALEQTVVTWMSRHEGLRPQRRARAGIVWERDSSPVTAIRRGLKLSQGTGALRSATSITHHVESVGEGAHVVTIEADTRPITQVGASVGGSVATAGLIAGLSVGLAGAVTLPVGLAIGVGSIAFGVGLSLLISRTWAASMRTGLRRALAGIANPELSRATESVPSMIRRLRDEWREAKAETKRDWR